MKLPIESTVPSQGLYGNAALLSWLNIVPSRTKSRDTWRGGAALRHFPLAVL